jgi:hypothetical protein
MNRIKFLALAAIASFAIAPSAPKAAAQINFYIGVAPDCPYGYYDYVPHNCAPDGSTDRNGLSAASSLAPIRGSMAPTTLRGRSTTRSIHSTDIAAHCPRLGMSRPRSGEPRAIQGKRSARWAR